jgi:hypothetical protein
MSLFHPAAVGGLAVLMAMEKVHPMSLFRPAALVLGTLVVLMAMEKVHPWQDEKP